MKTSISKFTLFEYLSGRANPLERQLVEDWIRLNENTEIFFQWLLEYETKCPQFLPDEESAINTLMHRIHSGEGLQDVAREQDEAEGRGFYFFQKSRPLWLIAASITILLGCGWFFRDPILYRTYQTGYGQTTDVYLEDGSRVALNANSRLKVPRFGFSPDVRNVSLQGEAEFSVSHTIDHKRFVVNTSDQFKVEVLGTTFTVFARPRGTRVALKTGSVRIDYSRDNQQKNVMMEPGDLAVLDQQGEVQLERKQDVKTFAPWTEQRYVFNATSLRDITAMIEENFGQKVTLSNPEIGQRTITGNFKTKDAHELLKTVSEVLDLHMEQTGKTTLLSNN